MKFSFKKALCLLLTVCILCSTFALPVFADAESSNSVVIAEGLTAEKLCSLRQSHTINPGRDITYTIKLDNSTNADASVTVTDVVPAVAILKEGCDNVEESLMTWEAVVPANDSLEISYTLTVKDDSALLGSAIDGSNAIVNETAIDCYDIYIENTFGEVDNKKLVSSIDNLNHALTTDTALARIIYNNATSFNFTMDESSVDVLEQIFVTGVNAGAGSGSSGGVEEMPAIAANYMDMIAPTLYGGTEVDITPDEYFRGEPNTNPTNEDLLIGDLVFLGSSTSASVYIYNGDQLLKLDSGNFKELVREDANEVLNRAVASERFVVLRPAYVLTGYHQSPAEYDENLTDVQKAIVGTALAYHKRGYRVQYDDTTVAANEYRWQKNLNAPEAYTQDNICYTNCSAFCNDVYRFAIGYNEADLAQNLKHRTNERVWTHSRTDLQEHTEEEKAEVMNAFYDNLQVGDIIAVYYNKYRYDENGNQTTSRGGGHAMLYVGNGQIIHSGGANISYGGADKIETSIKLMRVADLWTEGNNRYFFKELNSIYIIRPLKTWKGTEIPQNTINRITTMAGIVGEKLSSKNEYTSVNPGDEITYTFSVYNTNEEAKTLEISDKVPENTTFISGDLANDNGNLSYNLTVGANETKRVSYTVKVNENVPFGTRILSNDATIGGVVHPTHEVLVAKTLTDEQQSAITTAYNNNKASLSGSALANAIYKDVLGVDKVLKHDTVDDILSVLTRKAENGEVINGTTVSLSGAYVDDNYLFLDDTYYSQMLVPKMFGGRYVYIPEIFADALTRLPRQVHFIPGDIIVSKTKYESSTILQLYTKEGLINLTKKTINKTPDESIQAILANKCFAVLRPSMASSYEYTEPEISPLEIYIEELKELNKTTISDDATLAIFEAKIAEIDAYLAENTDEALTTAQLTVYNTAKASIKLYKDAQSDSDDTEENVIRADGKVWFNLNGNARLFVKSDSTIYKNRTTYTDYLPGVDFAGYVPSPTGDFTTDQANVAYPSYGGGMFVYTSDKNNTTISKYTFPDFTTGENNNLFWEIAGVKYLVQPNKNVIKNMSFKIPTAALTDADMIARYSSLNTDAVIDVPNGRYESVGILSGARVSYAKAFSVSLYYEGEAEPVVISGADMKISCSAATSYKDGTLYIQNFLNSNANSDGPHYFAPKTIAVDSSKVLTKFVIKDTSVSNNRQPLYIISAWGVEKPVTIEELIAQLSELNNSPMEDSEDIAKLKAQVTEIDNFLAKNTDVTLTAQQQEIYDTAKGIINSFEDVKFTRAEGKIWFDLNGNARLFVKSDEEAYKNRTTYKDYLPGVDFAGSLYGTSKNFTPSGVFETDQAGVAFPGYGGAMFVYTLNKNNASPGAYTLPDFTTDENGNCLWEINGLKYLVRPDQKIIKNLAQKIKTTSLTDPDMIARYQSLNTAAVIDVPDRKYGSVGIVVGALLKYGKRTTVSLYYEGETEPVVINGDNMKMLESTTVNYTKGTFYMKNFTDSNENRSSSHYFVPKTIETDPNKVLTKIEVKDSGASYGAYPIYVVSAWGIEKDKFIETSIYELGKLNSLSDYDAIAEKLAAINTFLANTSQTLEVLTAEQKAVYDVAVDTLEKIKISGSIEIAYKEGTPYANVTINNEAGLEGKTYKVIIVYIGENNVQLGRKIVDGTSTSVATESFEIEITDVPAGTKTIKGLLWKDFATLIPLTK